MANESPPDPENGEGRPPRRSRPTHELLEHSLLSLKDTEGVTTFKFDPWLCRYLIWIEAESCRLNGERICEHYIARAWPVSPTLERMVFGLPVIPPGFM